MRHIVLLLIVLLATYFGWRFTPSRPKFFIKRFIGDHLPWVVLIVGLVISLLFVQSGVTTKLF